MSRRDEIRAELKAEVKRMKPYHEAQAARVIKIAAEGRSLEITASMYDADKRRQIRRQIDRDILDRYDKGLMPGDMDLIDCTIDEFMATVRKRLEEDNY